MRSSAAAPVAPGRCWFGGVSGGAAVEYAELPRDAARVASGGFWAVVGEFEGPIRAWRFGSVRRGSPRQGRWQGPDARRWRSSLDRAQYCERVAEIRERIRAGDVYQVNLCRLLTVPMPDEPDAAALSRRLRRDHPAALAGYVQVRPAAGLPPVWVVSASPELFLRVRDGVISSGPIKGTATSPGSLLPKDHAENIMITDMVRNDLQQVCWPGTVAVTSLLEPQRYPGLVHLVTTVEGRLRTTDWSRILAATYPPASVSGAPKQAALGLISQLEAVPRGPYCGAFGWIDSDRGAAELAVGIRTFCWQDGELRFGTGAGITWGSVAEQEWAETELKAARLISLASR